MENQGKLAHRDLEAVENAVASDLSNAFVEVYNSIIKMIKHTMYGRCGLKLYQQDSCIDLKHVIWIFEE